MINADVIRNKEIQKITGFSPAQEAWKAANLLPHKKKLTLWERFKIWWYDITFKRLLEAEYRRGFEEGRHFEFKTALENELRLRQLNEGGNERV